MSHNQLKSPFLTVKAWLLTVCLCALLIPGVGVAEDSQHQLDTAVQPAPVPALLADDTEQLSREEPREGTDQSIGREIREALEASGFNNARGVVGLGLLIPLFTVIFIFGGPVLVIIAIAILHYRSKNRIAQIRAECTLRALETGQEIPSELTNIDGADKPADNLRKGIKNIGLGAGLLLALTILIGIKVGALGFILIGIGAAQLLIWKLENDKSKEAA